MAHSDEGPGEVERFWELAKVHARLNPVPSYFGPGSLESVPPPTFSLGDTPAAADQAVAALLDEKGAVLETERGAFASEDELPVVGALGIVLDGNDHPRALVETTGVSVEGEKVREELRVVYGA